MEEVGTFVGFTTALWHAYVGALERSRTIAVFIGANRLARLTIGGPVCASNAHRTLSYDAAIDSVRGSFCIECSTANPAPDLDAHQTPW